MATTDTLFGQPPVQAFGTPAPLAQPMTPQTPGLSQQTQDFLRMIQQNGAPAAGGTPTPNIAGTPTYADVMAQLRTPITHATLPTLATPGADTAALFQQGITAAQPYTGISPQYQAILDTIKQQQDYASGVGAAQAQSLAAKRGLTGSSVEQFGTQEAIGQASRAAQDASSKVLLENAAQQNTLQQLQAKLYGDRATTLETLGSQQGIAGLDAASKQNIADTAAQSTANQLGAQLTSDEIASLRNMDVQQQSLALQKYLGERGIQVSMDNIQAAQEIAKQTGQNNLLTAGITAGASLLAPAASKALATAFPSIFGAAAGAGTTAAAAGATGAGTAAAGTAGATTAAGGAGASGAGAAGGAGAAAGLAAGATVVGAMYAAYSTLNSEQQHEIKDYYSNLASRALGGGDTNTDAKVNLGNFNIPAYTPPANPAATDAVNGIYASPVNDAGSYHEGRVYDFTERISKLYELEKQGLITHTEFLNYATPLFTYAKSWANKIASASSDAANSVNPVLPKLEEIGKLINPPTPAAQPVGSPIPGITASSPGQNPEADAARIAIYQQMLASGQINQGQFAQLMRPYSVPQSTPPLGGSGNAPIQAF